jgi:hypothetical protein
MCALASPRSLAAALTSRRHWSGFVDPAPPPHLLGTHTPKPVSPVDHQLSKVIPVHAGPAPSTRPRVLHTQLCFAKQTVCVTKCAATHGEPMRPNCPTITVTVLSAVERQYLCSDTVRSLLSTTTVLPPVPVTGPARSNAVGAQCARECEPTVRLTRCDSALTAPAARFCQPPGPGPHLCDELQHPEAWVVSLTKA